MAQEKPHKLPGYDVRAAASNDSHIEYIGRVLTMDNRRSFNRLVMLPVLIMLVIVWGVFFLLMWLLGGF